MLETFKKLGISLEEQKQSSWCSSRYSYGSVSVSNNLQKNASQEKGIIFCSISEAIQEHPELVRKYLGTVVPQKDNFYAALNFSCFFRWFLLLYP